VSDRARLGPTEDLINDAKVGAFDGPDDDSSLFLTDGAFEGSLLKITLEMREGSFQIIIDGSGIGNVDGTDS